MIDNFYLHQLMKKSDRKNYLGNRHGVFTITFPKKIKNNRRLKFVFKPGNTYVLKGERLENIDLVFPNSNVLVESIEFLNCSIEASDGVVNYYCNNKSNGIATTRASKISVSDYYDENFIGLPFISDNLQLHNTRLYNINNDYAMDILFNANQSIELDNCLFNFNVSSNISLNPNQKIKLCTDKLSIKNSTISTIVDNKSIKNNDNIDSRNECHISILVSSKDIELENSSIESGYNINVYGDNMTLNNSLIGSIRNSEMSVKNVTMDAESDIVAIKPVFWEQYVSNYDIAESTDDILYCCEKSLRKDNQRINNHSSKISELNAVKEQLLGDVEKQKKNLR